MLLEYCSQRLSIARMGPLTLAIAGASQLAAPSGHSIPIDVLLATVLIAQFRTWDDLADRERDATIHPERVTVRASTVAPLVFACVLLAIFGVAIVTFRGSAAAATALMALNLLAALWYWRREGRSLLGDHVLLAKYPMFVSIVVVSRGGALSPTAWLVMTALFLGACVYEAVHDETSPGSERPTLLICEALLLALTLVACGVRL